MIMMMIKITERNPRKLSNYKPVLGLGIMILRSICLRASFVDPRLPFTDDLSLISSYLPN